MALLQTWGAGINRIDETLLDVRYVKKRVYGLWEYAEGTTIKMYYRAWAYARIATLNRRYVGMTKDTAIACAASLSSYFTRQTWVSEWSPEGKNFLEISGGANRMTDITVEYVAGHMYDVHVVVNEVDEKMSLYSVEPYTKFVQEDLRDYEEPQH